MSSDILLQELTLTVQEVTPHYLTDKLSSLTSDGLNALLVKEQVRLASLGRQQELALKLASEMPGRMDKLETDAKSLAQLSKSLETEEVSRLIRIANLKTKQSELTSQIASISQSLTEKRELDAISNFQKNELWTLIGQVVEVRRGLLTTTSQMRSMKEEADFEYLASRIEANDRLIKDIEYRLSSISSG